MAYFEKYIIIKFAVIHQDKDVVMEIVQFNKSVIYQNENLEHHHLDELNYSL